MAQRGTVDLIMALGLIHHLAISNNVPLADVADYNETGLDAAFKDFYQIFEKISVAGSERTLYLMKCK